MTRDISVQHLDHTGDAGFVVTAPGLAALFIACAEQMTLLRAPDAEIRPMIHRDVNASGFDLAELLVGWLAEIHADGEAYREIYGAYAIDHLDVAEGDCRVVGRSLGEPLDPTRHRLAREIKAVTYHQAWVREEAGLWRAQVVFDL